MPERRDTVYQDMLTNEFFEKVEIPKTLTFQLLQRPVAFANFTLTMRYTTSNFLEISLNMPVPKAKVDLMYPLLKNFKINISEIKTGLSEPESALYLLFKAKENILGSFNPQLISDSIDELWKAQSGDGKMMFLDLDNSYKLESVELAHIDKKD